MKLGILGAGMIVHDFLTFAHDLENMEITAIAATPRSVEKLTAMCAEHNIPAWYTDQMELITDPNVDTVYVATPNHLHYEAVKAALNAGKNVICEKPFTSTYEQAAELTALAKEKKLFLFEAVSTRYLPNTHEIKKLLPQLGNLKIVNMNYSQYSSRYDAFKSGVVQPAFDPAKSGGALMDLNIYNINLAVMLFGAPKEVHYFANIERGIDTSGVLVMEYDGFVCTCIGAKDCKAPLLSSIQGDNGCILIPAPANHLDKFEFQLNKNMKGPKPTAAGDLQDYNQGRHRMWHEFVEFEKIMQAGDHETADQMNEITLITMDIQNKARKDAGIVFADD